MAYYLQPCSLQESDMVTRCYGTLKTGGVYSNRAKGPSIPGVMPMCKIHRRQIKLLGVCKLPLACGFECGQLFEWKPHEFSLCSRHRQNAPCSFFRVPVEIRCRIYDYLLPHKVVPAQSLFPARCSMERFDRSILLINHQIHEEAASLLYHTRTFAIRVSENIISMCNMPKQFRPDNYPHSNLYFGGEYKRHLMILERQDAKFQRKIRDNGNGETLISGSPVWTPLLCNRYFTMIKSFRIELDFRHPVICTLHEPPSTTLYAEQQSILALWLFHYCDQIHKLISRLQRSPEPLTHLEISIKFSNLSVEQEAAFHAAQYLVDPFRRLCGVVKPQVLSITANDLEGRQIELLCLSHDSPASRNFAKYLIYWYREISKHEPSLNSDSVLETYWKLEGLLSRMKEHDPNVETRAVRFAGILQAARVARESNSMKDLSVVRDIVITIWSGYLDNHAKFRASIGQSIEAISSIVDLEA